MTHKLAALASEIADLVIRIGQAEHRAAQETERADTAESRMAELKAELAEARKPKPKATRKAAPRKRTARR